VDRAAIFTSAESADKEPLNMADRLLDFYSSGSFYDNNTTNSFASKWKALLVTDILETIPQQLKIIADVGSGDCMVARHIANVKSNLLIDCYDVTPPEHRFNIDETPQLKFYPLSALESSDKQYDLIMALDVIEHVACPRTFLSSLAMRTRRVLLHVPLDLSVVSMLRPAILREQLESAGHVTFYNVETLRIFFHSMGMYPTVFKLTDAYRQFPQNPTLAQKLVRLMRTVLACQSRTFSANLLGGQTALVLIEFNHVE